MVFYPESAFRCHGLISFWVFNPIVNNNSGHYQNIYLIPKISRNTMKTTQEKYSICTLIIIFVAFVIGGWNTCQAQETKKQYPQKIVLEMELEQVVKLKIPKDVETPMTIEELNKIKQSYPSKGGAINLKRESVIPEVDAIIKEEDYDENK